MNYMQYKAAELLASRPQEPSKKKKGPSPAKRASLRRWNEVRRARGQAEARQRDADAAGAVTRYLLALPRERLDGWLRLCDLEAEFPEYTRVALAKALRAAGWENRLVGTGPERSWHWFRAS